MSSWENNPSPVAIEYEAKLASRAGLDAVKMKILFERINVVAKAPISFVMSLRPHVSAWLTLDGLLWNVISDTFIKKGRDSSVGIATRYYLDGPGIESRWGLDFLPPSRPVLGTTQPPWGKAAGAWFWPPTLIFSAEVMKG